MPEKTQLYLITPASFALDDFSNTLRETLSAGPVACLQLRMKNCSLSDVRQAAKTFLPICSENDVALLINDHAEIALEVGADGAHLGQGDGDVRAARALLGIDAMIGVTCHNSRHLAFEAGEQGADYVAFGSFFPTDTKDVAHTATPDILTSWVEIIEIPCVAIGGIKVDNCSALVEAGANFIAVSSGVWDYSDGPKAAVEAFNKVFDDIFEKMEND